jgi:hypothetical protein
MSVDFPAVANAAATVVIIAILFVGIYRASQIRRAFVNSAYRSRATWSAFLMLIILIVMVANYVPFPSSGILSTVGALPFIALLLAIFAYAERSAIVAMETDFFHRNTLGWLRARWPAAIVLVAFDAADVALSPVAEPNALELALANLAFVAVIGVLAYATATLVIGARRSSDRTLRRSILLLGLALSTLVLSLVLTFPLVEGTLPFVIVNKGTALVGIYLIYRSMMSLSPLGRIDKDIG